MHYYNLSHYSQFLITKIKQLVQSANINPLHSFTGDSSGVVLVCRLKSGLANCFEKPRFFRLKKIILKFQKSKFQVFYFCPIFKQIIFGFTL